MKDAFFLTKPRRFWIVSVAVALISAVFVAPFLGRLPWLICVPMSLGMVFVVAAEFWESMTSSLGQPASQEHFRPGTAIGA